MIKLALTICLIAVGWKFLKKEPYLTFPNHRPGPCRRVLNIADGSEDLAILRDGKAIGTSGLRNVESGSLENVRGKLFMVDLMQNESADFTAQEIRIDWHKKKQEHFNPHGLKVFEKAKGVIIAYVINHEPEGDAIEIFDINLKTKLAKPVKTIRDKLIFNANSLAVINDEEFYVTNLAYFRNAFLQTLELKVPAFGLGSVVYYKKGHAKLVHQFQATPNGIDTDPSKKFLFIASYMSQQLWIYKINDTMSITRIKKIPLGTHPDNLFYDKEINAIWIGAHPSHSALMDHLDKSDVKAPSQVLVIKFLNKSFDGYKIYDPYSDDGKQISGSSSAVRFNEKLLIGTVANHLALCHLTQDIFT